MSERLRISLIATVLNEYGSLPGWVTGLQAQSRLPDECIVIDGGSRDGTYEYLRAVDVPFAWIVRQRAGCTIAHGRNTAIALSQGEVIVVTDAGTRAHPEWLERLIEPLEHSGDFDLVAGFFEPAGTGIWSRALAASTLPDAAEIDPAAFLASSRSFAFRRVWFEAGFRYPNWLDFCEDVVLDLQLRRAGARQVFEPRALVAFEPRPGPLSFARQYFRYARGDGKAGLFGKRHAIRYVSYLLGTLVLVRRRPLEVVVAITLGLVYLRAPVARFRRWTPRAGVKPGEAVLAGVLIASQRALGDVAKMVGYPVGIVWRISRDRSLKLRKSGWSSRSPDGFRRRF